MSDTDKILDKKKMGKGRIGRETSSGAGIPYLGGSPGKKGNHVQD